MINEFEFKSDWWLPADLSNRIPGTLRFSPGEGATLDLIGSFKDMQHLGEALDPEIILGETTNGKKVTLYKCFETRSSMSLPGRITSVLHANYVFVGVHFPNPESILFKDMSVRYLYLDEWVRKSGFSIELPTGEATESITVRYSLPQPIQIATNAQGKISLNFSANIPMPSVTESIMKQKVEIKIETEGEKQFWYFKTLIYQLQNFLCLGMMKTTWPVMIRGKTEINKTRIEGKDYYEPVEVFFQLVETTDVNSKINSFEMLFLFNDIADSIGQCLDNWLKKSISLEPVFDLYFGAFYNREMYLQQRFLNLSQALESYHRRILQGKYQSDEEYLKGLYEGFMRSIPNNLDRDFKTSLTNKMKFLNEFSLRKRLSDLKQKYTEILSLLIRNIDKFVEDTVNTRNFLTHYDLSLESKAKSGEELYILCEKLKFFLEVCFLFELGLSSAKVKALVEKCESYRDIKRMPG